MNAERDLEWLEPFLADLRCPETGQRLRWATVEECGAAGLSGESKALARQDGSRVFAIDGGIPLLLPSPVVE